MAVTVAELEAKLTADIKNFERGMKKADRRLDDLQGTTKKANSRLDSLRSGMVKLGIVAGGAIGLDQVRRFLLSSIDAASRLEESVSAVRVVFGAASQTVLKFASDTDDAVFLAASSVNQLAAQTGSLLINFGQNAVDAADNTVMLTKRAADLASVFDTDVDTALGAVNAALRGEVEPLRKFSANVDAATVRSKALEMNLIGSGDAMDNNAKVAARLAVIMDQTAFAQGDAARNADSFASTQRRLQERFEALQVVIGQQLLPVAVEFLDWLADVTPTITNNAVPALQFLGKTIAELADPSLRLVGVVQEFGEGLETPEDNSKAMAQSLINLGLASADFLALPWERNLPRLRLTGDAMADLATDGSDATVELIRFHNELRRAADVAAAARPPLTNAAQAIGKTAAELAVLFAPEGGRTLFFTAGDIARDQAMLDRVIRTSNTPEVMAAKWAAGVASMGRSWDENTDNVQAGIAAMLQGWRDSSADFLMWEKDLRDTLNSVISLWDDLPEAVDTSLDDMQKRLDEQVKVTGRFNEAVRGLAPALQQELMRQFAQNPIGAANLAEALLGDPTRAARAWATIMAINTQLDIADIFNSPGFAQMLIDSGTNAAALWAAGFSNLALAGIVLPAIPLNQSEVGTSDRFAKLRAPGAIDRGILEDLAARAGGEFQGGGIVPGPRGAPVPILAHGGETVGSGGTTVVQLVLDGRVMQEVVVKGGDTARRRGRA